MSLSVRAERWKVNISNKRIGTSSVETVKDLTVKNLDSEMGNESLAGYAAKRPKQGKRM